MSNMILVENKTIEWCLSAAQVLKTTCNKVKLDAGESSAEALINILHGILSTPKEAAAPSIDNRCLKEKAVEEYFGLNQNNTHEKFLINTDFGHLVNLLYLWEEKSKK